MTCQLTWRVVGMMTWHFLFWSRDGWCGTMTQQTCWCVFVLVLVTWLDKWCALFDSCSFTVQSDWITRSLHWFHACIYSLMMSPNACDNLACSYLGTWGACNYLFGIYLLWNSYLIPYMLVFLDSNLDYLLMINCSIWIPFCFK